MYHADAVASCCESVYANTISVCPSHYRDEADRKRKKKLAGMII